MRRPAPDPTTTDALLARDARRARERAALAGKSWVERESWRSDVAAPKPDPVPHRRGPGRPRKGVS